jgi:hypothetical protein
VSRKRPQDGEESSNDAYPCDDNSPRNKTAAGSADFEVDLENDSDDSSDEALPSQAGDWAKKFKELCQYRRSKVQCTFHSQDQEYVELSRWVFSQRCECRRKVRDKDSSLTPQRVKALEGIGFVWSLSRPCWEDRFCELADYRKSHGHCNDPFRCSENTKLARWVAKQRDNYRLQQEGKTSQMTLSRVLELKA